MRRTTLLLVCILCGTQVFAKPLQTILLLPFSAGDRMTEYYEGVLLALEDVKKQGISVSLQVFDIGQDTTRLAAVFQELHWTDIDLVIGGLSNEQVNMIADFCQLRGVPYVIPFTSRTTATENNPNVYQINTPQAELQEQAIEAFVAKYAKSTIFFYDVPKGNKNDFTSALKRRLTEKGMAFKLLKEADLRNLPHLLDGTHHTVIVPNDDNEPTLVKLLAPLRAVMAAEQGTQVSLFGYPAWQNYSVKYSDDFFSTNVCLYSLFYTDVLSPEVNRFRRDFIHWYSKDMINSYPKYALLGYDTARYFLQMLGKHDTSYRGLQTDFYFQQTHDMSGYINTNLYMVEFQRDFTVVSTQLR